MFKVLLLTLLACNIFARRQNRLENIEEQQKEEIEYVIGTVRSFWSGFQQSFYDKDQTKLDSRCFDEESQDEVGEVWWAVTHIGFENTLDAIIASANLFYDDYESCHYLDVISRVIKHCDGKSKTIQNKEGEDEEVSPCGFGEVLTNLETNVFTIVEVASSVGDVIANNEVTELDEMKSIMLQLGKDVSQMIKLLLGMQKTSYEHAGRNRIDERNMDIDD